ncbi:MAG: mechanosensitive ion channel family protein [Hyphomicrobiaceae bacterium]|nr:mechanosensitive ion channel family protein [Hyphomicrobiaceae bacterium]
MRGRINFLSAIVIAIISTSSFHLWGALNGFDIAWAEIFSTNHSKNSPKEQAASYNTEQTDFYPSTLAQSIERQAETLNLLRKAVERLRGDNKGLENQRLKLVKLTQEMDAIKVALEPLLKAIDREISQLSSPAETSSNAVEVPELVQERDRLEEIRSKIIAAQKRTSLSLLRSQKLEKRIQDYHLQNFTTNILQLVESPISSKLWDNLDAVLPRLWIQINTIADNWWTSAKLDPFSLSLIAIFGSLCYIFLSIIRNRIITHATISGSTAAPGFLFRATQASWFVTVMVMPGTISSVVLFIVGDLFLIWDGSIRIFAYTAISAFIISLFIMALATSILQPSRPSWRLVELPTPIANRLLWIINTMAVVYAADLFLHRIIRLFYMPVEVRILETSLANGAFAGLLVVFALTALPDEQDIISARLVRLSLFILRIPLFLAAITIIAVTIMGYVALGRFVAGQIMLMGVGGVAVLLLHLAIRVVTTSSFSKTFLFEKLSERNGWFFSHRQQIANTTAFFANVFLLGVTIALLLLSWGLPFSQLTDSLKSIFFGFEIGQVKISLFQILIGISLFLTVLFVTRLIQSWMSRTLQNTPSVDQGIADSVHTGFGYLGMSIAAMIGISYAGVDLSQLTLVIGALSLGVGLGLQSIVNNFVSGLILLIERPVKVGDWVVIGDEQGYVRKISVRATEIETFDRASVIIPNSALIGGIVQNWTHRNTIGRIIIKVNVSYNTSPQHVVDILLDIARDSDRVLSLPEPCVSFDDFGSSSLNFSLRCFIEDINDGIVIKTTLRTEILNSFKRNGIEIPYLQHDLYIRHISKKTNEQEALM